MHILSYIAYVHFSIPTSRGVKLAGLVWFDPNIFLVFGWVWSKPVGLEATDHLKNAKPTALGYLGFRFGLELGFCLVTGLDSGFRAGIQALFTSESTFYQRCFLDTYGFFFC